MVKTIIFIWLIKKQIEKRLTHQSNLPWEPQYRLVKHFPEALYHHFFILNEQFFTSISLVLLHNLYSFL